FRQIVYANPKCLELFRFSHLDKIVGLRPGEAFNCINAFKTDGGCGTTLFCSTCDAIKAVLQAQQGRKSVQECRISTKNEDNEAKALDLRVTATPQIFDDELYTIFSLVDISDEKRRRILEKIFFHDITNTAGAINGLAEIMNDTQSMEELEAFGLGEMLSTVSNRLLDEIQAQRQLMAAENGELTVDAEYFYTETFMQDLVNIYKSHPVADDKNLIIDKSIENVLLMADRAILGRVIGNMVKNALEACSPDETVTIGCQKLSNSMQFWVHNPKHMPKRIQLQIFQRSFSTKGHGRGLGTYSMKLLSENFLQGRISFESSAEDGTTFIGVYPIKWSNPE
ncbi:MAG: sensor histidine kinase, partial [Chloroflexi bacterium]